MDVLNLKWNSLLNGWKDGLQLKLRVLGVSEGFLIAALYAIAAWGSRQFSVDQFHLGAGVRVSALILCPRPLWPYLLLGEYACFAVLRYPMIESRGLAWVVLGSAFLMPAVMAIAVAHRRVLIRAPDIWLLSVATSAAVVVSLLNVSLSQLLWPVPLSTPISTRVIRYVLGDFTGILTLAPLAMLWIRRNTEQERRARSRATLAPLAVLLLLGFFSLQIPPSHVGATSALHLAMVFPAILVTRRHGWWGAAVSLPIMSFLIGLSITSTGLPASFDPAIFKNQQSFAVIAVSLAALGSSISHHQDRSERREYERRQIVSLARTSQTTGESHLRLNLDEAAGTSGCCTQPRQHSEPLLAQVPRADQHGLSRDTRACGVVPGAASRWR